MVNIAPIAVGVAPLRPIDRAAVAQRCPSRAPPEPRPAPGSGSLGRSTGLASRGCRPVPLVRGQQENTHRGVNRDQPARHDEWQPVSAELIQRPPSIWSEQRSGRAAHQGVPDHLDAPRRICCGDEGQSGDPGCSRGGARNRRATHQRINPVRTRTAGSPPPTRQPRSSSAAAETVAEVAEQRRRQQHAEHSCRRATPAALRSGPPTAVWRQRNDYPVDEIVHEYGVGDHHEDLPGLHIASAERCCTCTPRTAARTHQGKCPIVSASCRSPGLTLAQCMEEHESCRPNNKLYRCDAGDVVIGTAGQYSSRGRRRPVRLHGLWLAILIGAKCE